MACGNWRSSWQRKRRRANARPYVAHECARVWRGLRMIAIRSIHEGDADEFLDLSKRLDEETQFMMLELGERQTTAEEQRERIRAILAKDNQIIFVAEGEGRLLGYVAGLGGSYMRNRHCAHVVIGVLQAFSGQGGKLAGKVGAMGG